MATHDDDPAMAEAIARSEEARAQILRGKAAGNPAYKTMADDAEKRARNASRRVAGLPDDVRPASEGTDLSGQLQGGATPSHSAETADTRAAVAIADGWRDLTWQERRSIASKVSDAPISNGEDANAAIEAELARRSAK